MVREAEEASGPSEHTRRCAKWRRRRVVLVCLAAFAIVLEMAYVYLPSWVIQRRLVGAQIALEHARLEIDGETSKLLSPSCSIFAPSSLLRIPLMHYEARIHNVRATVFVDKHDSRNAEMGVFMAPEDIVIKSSEDVNVTVVGLFDITGEKILGPFVNKFLVEKTISATLQVQLDVSVKAWGWLPFYFKGVAMHYTATIPAMSNFATRLIQVHEILSAEGLPKNLTVGCSASIYNPSPLELALHDYVQMQVVYEFQKQNFTIGKLRVSSMSIAPGANLVAASFSVIQDGTNEEAITDMISAYMGGEQSGFGPAGTKPFLVSVRDDGDATASSHLVRAATAGLSVTVLFDPKPFSFLQNITADFVVGGSLISRQPELWNATVHVKILNPLPTHVRLDEVHLEAYHKSLQGAYLYNFTRSSQDLGGRYWIEPHVWGNQILNFQLYPLFGEFQIPDSIKTITELIEEAVSSNISVGIKTAVKFAIGGDGGFQQRVVYINRALYAPICYHVEVPGVACDMGQGHEFGQAAPPALALRKVLRW